MVSKANDDLPEPDKPVITISESRGSRRSMPLRLCSRAPRTTISRFWLGFWVIGSVQLFSRVGRHGITVEKRGSAYSDKAGTEAPQAAAIA